MAGGASVFLSIAFPVLIIFVVQNVHAIGDRANGIVLDAFEASLQGVNVSALRPRLEHAQLMTKADMQRLGRLGGEIQPSVPFSALANYSGQ